MYNYNYNYEVYIYEMKGHVGYHTKKYMVP